MLADRLTEAEARAALAAEWKQADPASPDEVAALWNVPPCCSMDDMENRSGINVVVPAQRLGAVGPRTTDIPRSDLYNLGRGQFGRPLMFPSCYFRGRTLRPVPGSPEQSFGMDRRAVSPFVNHVHHVVGRRSEPQVPPSRTLYAVNHVYTGTVVPETSLYIAGMQNEKAVRNSLAGSKHPANMVNGQDSAVVGELAVPMATDGSGPDPAVSGFLSACIERSGERCVKLGMHSETPIRCASPLDGCNVAGALL